MKGPAALTTQSAFIRCRPRSDVSSRSNAGPVVMLRTFARWTRTPSSRIVSSMNAPNCCALIEPARRMWMTVATSCAKAGKVRRISA